MKIKDFVEQVERCPASDLYDKLRVYDNQVILMHSPVVGLARELIKRDGYVFVPSREHIAPGILLKKGEQVGLYFHKSRLPLSGEVTTSLGYKTEDKVKKHSREQQRLFDTWVKLSLRSEISHDTRAQISEAIWSYLLPIISCLIKTNRDFCLPHVLPEPVYSPDNLDDKVQGLVSKGAR